MNNPSIVLTGRFVTRLSIVSSQIRSVPWHSENVGTPFIPMRFHTSNIRKQAHRQPWQICSATNGIA
jgi:hypothetical protein